MTLRAGERIAVHWSGAKRAERIVTPTFLQPHAEIDRDRDPDKSGVESEHIGLFVGLRPEREALLGCQRPGIGLTWVLCSIIANTSLKIGSIMSHGRTDNNTGARD